jgi:hypothetical protein
MVLSQTNRMSSSASTHTSSSRPVPDGYMTIADVIMMNVDQAFNTTEVFAHELGHAAFMPHTSVGGVEVLQNRTAFDSIMDYTFEDELTRSDGTRRSGNSPIVTQSDKVLALEYWRIVSSNPNNLNKPGPMVGRFSWKFWSPYE